MLVSFNGTQARKTALGIVPLGSLPSTPLPHLIAPNIRNLSLTASLSILTLSYDAKAEEVTNQNQPVSGEKVTGPSGPLPFLSLSNFDFFID